MLYVLYQNGGEVLQHHTNLKIWHSNHLKISYTHNDWVKGREGIFFISLVFLVGGDLLLLLFHLLGGDYGLFINFTLGHFACRLALLWLILLFAFFLRPIAGAGVNAGLVAVALPNTSA